jgi:perosamine synthetase
MVAVVAHPEFGISRDELARRLLADGIETRTFFCPMNQQPCLLPPEDRPLPACPVADSLWERGLYLPSSVDLTDETIAFIAHRIRAAAHSASRSSEQPRREQRFAA